jgi:hypothetical protein
MAHLRVELDLLLRLLRRKNKTSGTFAYETEVRTRAGRKPYSRLISRK